MKYAIGIDLGGTNIAAALLDSRYRILDRITVPTALPRSPEAIVATMAGLAKTLAERNGVRAEAVGIGTPGLVEGRSVRSAVNLGFTEVPLADMMEAATTLPCTIVNDGNAAALGESVAGAGRGAESLVMITLGTGVGGGIVDHGKILAGFNGAGGEIGHFVIRPGGRKCGCGKRGCFEAYCSATALIRRTREAWEACPTSVIGALCGGDGDKINGKTAFDAMRAGDETGRAVVDGYIADLAQGIGNLVMLLQPEVVALGGGISHEGETLMAPLRELVYRDAYFDEATRRTALVAAELRGDAGVIGAAVAGAEGVPSGR